MSISPVPCTGRATALHGTAPRRRRYDLSLSITAPTPGAAGVAKHHWLLTQSANSCLNHIAACDTASAHSFSLDKAKMAWKCVWWKLCTHFSLVQKYPLFLVIVCAVTLLSLLLPAAMSCLLLSHSPYWQTGHASTSWHKAWGNNQHSDKSQGTA